MVQNAHSYIFLNYRRIINTNEFTRFNSFSLIRVSLIFKFYRHQERRIANHSWITLNHEWRKLFYERAQHTIHESKWTLVFGKTSTRVNMYQAPLIRSLVTRFFVMVRKVKNVIFYIKHNILQLSTVNTICFIV